MKEHARIAVDHSTGVTAGDSIPSLVAFQGAALSPDGQVVFAPRGAGEVGVFEPGVPDDVVLHPLVN